jgi:hypothetical protein
MANQFDKPVSNKYVSQYVKAPVQALKTTGARYQKRSDKNRKKALLLRKSMEQDPLPEHEDMVNDRLEKHQKDLDQITEDGDYLNAGSRINDKVIEFKNDQVLKAARDAKKQKQQISKSIDEDLSDAPKNYRDFQKSKIQVGNLEVDANGNVEAQVSGPTYPKYMSPSERQEYMNNEVKRFAERYDGPASEELSGITTFEGIQNYLQTADVSAVTKNRIRRGLASSVTDEQFKFAQEYANANPLEHLTEETYKKLEDGTLDREDVLQNPQKFVRDETQIWETNSKGEPIYRNEKGERVSSKNENAIIQVNNNTMWGGLISAKSTQKAHQSIKRDLREIDGGPGGSDGPGGGNGSDEESPLVLLRSGDAHSLNQNNYDEARKRYQELDTIIKDQQEQIDEMKEQGEKGSPAYLKEMDRLNNLKTQRFNYKQRLDKVNKHVDPDEAFKKAGYDPIDKDDQNSYGVGRVMEGNFERLSAVEARSRIKEGLKKNKTFNEIFPKGVDQTMRDPQLDSLYQMYSSVKEQYDKQVTEAFKNKDISRQPTVLYGSPDGKGSTIVGNINEINSTEFGDGTGWSMAYSSGKSARQKLKEELGKVGSSVDLGEEYEGESGQLISKKSVKMTTDINEQNHPVYEMTSYAQVKQDGETTTVPIHTMYITKGDQGLSEYIKGAKELENGNKRQRQVAAQMTANMKYMPALKQAGVTQMEPGQRRRLNLKSEDSNQNLYVERTEEDNIRIYDADKDDYTPVVGGIDQAARMLHNVEWNIKKNRRGQNSDKREQSEEEMEENSKEDLEESEGNGNNSNGDLIKDLPSGISDTKDPVRDEQTNPDKVINLDKGLYNFTSYAADEQWGSKVKDIITNVGSIESPDDIDSEIEAYDDSILAGKSQVIFDVAQEHDIDPEILVGLLKHESLMGSTDVARQNNNFGGITWNSNFPESQKGTPRPDAEGGNYVKFSSPRAGLEQQADLIAERKMTLS